MQMLVLVWTDTLTAVQIKGIKSWEIKFTLGYISPNVNFQGTHYIHFDASSLYSDNNKLLRFQKDPSVRNKWMIYF